MSERELLASIQIETFVEDGTRHFMATGSEGLGLVISAQDIPTLMRQVALVVPDLMQANRIWPRSK